MITAPLSAALLHGALEVETTPRGVVPHRLPAWARAQFPDASLGLVEAEPSGVRLVFRTTATVVELDTLPTRRALVGVPPRPAGVYDLLVDGHLTAQATSTGGTVVTIDMSTGSTTTATEPAGTLRFGDLPAGAKTVEIWLPHNERTELVALRTDEPVSPVDDTRRVWLHHGSSISQGSNATSPTAIWPAVAAARAGVSLINIGLSGNALLDPFTARALRDTPADIISVKIGINLVNADLMRLRAFVPAVHGFLDTIREGHPTTPLIVISPLLCPIHEDTPGPGAFDLAALRTGEVRFIATGDPAGAAAGQLTLRVIRDELARIVEQRADDALHYVDGLDLYGEGDPPLPDALHPDTATHRLIGERFGALLASR